MPAAAGSLRAVGASARIERFSHRGDRSFSQLSDHWGVAAEVVVAATPGGMSGADKGGVAVGKGGGGSGSGADRERERERHIRTVCDFARRVCIIRLCLIKNNFI